MLLSAQAAGDLAGTDIELVTEPMVRVAYLVPANRQAQDVRPIQNSLLLFQDWYRQQMEGWGLGPKTFTLETESDGVTPMVHVVNLSEADDYLRGDIWNRVNAAASEAGVPLWNNGEIWLLVPETDIEQPDGTIQGTVTLGAGFGSGLDPGVAQASADVLPMIGLDKLTNDQAYAGLVIPGIGPYPLVANVSYPWYEGSTLSSVASSKLGAMLHELSHGFGLPHDLRNDSNFRGNLMGNGLRGFRGAIYPGLYPSDQTYLSYGQALALSVSPYFNPGHAGDEYQLPTVSVTSGTTPLPVNGLLRIPFTASDDSGLTVAWLLKGGEQIDEMTLSGRSVSATFSTPYYAAGAAQTFEVAVFDIHGNRRNVDVAITPQAPSNYAPQPQIRAACGVAGLAQDVQLTAADSIDPGGDPSKLLVEWDFNNDGIYDTAKIPISQHPTIRFFTPGTYAARARLTDAGGATSISAPFPVRILPTITGTTGSDNYYLRVDPGDAGTLQIFSGTGPVGQPAYALPAAWGETLVFNGGLGDDQLIIDFSHGAPLPAGGLTFTGGDGANRIRTIGSSGADVFTIGDNRLTLNGSEVTCSGVEEFAIDGAGGGDSVSLVDGAAVMFTADQHLASLSISGNARLNLQDHELLMDSADLMQIRSWIQSGSLFSDAAILGKSMALGYASSGNGVLVKYTYRGDADLDGDVDGDDVAEWAANFTGSLTNPASPKLWSQGDWDYDGDVDGDDVAKWAVNFTGALTSSGLSIEPSTIASSDSAQAAQAPAQSVEIAKPRCTPPQLRPPCRPPRVMTLALWHPDVRPAVRILPTRNSFPTAFSFRADGHGILRYVDQPEADDVISLG